MCLFLQLFHILFGQYYQKNVAKKGQLRKKIKVRWSYRAGWGEGCIWNKGWFKPAHYDPLPEQHIPTYYQEMKQ